MRQKLKKSASSTNFWNNIANVLSPVILVAVLAFIKVDPGDMKEIILAFILGSSGHNIGNILAHMNKPDNILERPIDSTPNE